MAIAARKSSFQIALEKAAKTYLGVDTLHGGVLGRLGLGDTVTVSCRVKRP